MHKRTSENQSISLTTQQKSKRLKGEVRKLSWEKQAEIQQSTAPPERFQLRPDIIANRKLTEEEINLATDTISKSISDYRKISTSSQLIKAVKNTLIFFSQKFEEVPYVWTYKKDFITEDPVTTVLSRADLWHIFDLEYDFRKFVEMRDQLNTKISNNYLQDSYVSKILSEAKDIDELNDLNIYTKFQESKIAPEEEIHELRRRGIVANIKYLEYIHKGLLKIVEKFGVQVPLFVQNFYSETKSHQSINEDLSPLEIVQQFYPKYKFPDELLQQSLDLLAYEISIDPMFRKFVYNNYMQHGLLITSGPLEAISNDDECWSFCFWKIKIQKAFNIDGNFAQILYYKNQNLINVSFQLNNNNEFLENLENNIMSDNTLTSYEQWNKYRVDASLKAYNEILRPKIESRLIAKLKVNAEQWIMEQCMLNLERKINVKPLVSEISRSILPRIFALSSGFNESETVYCIHINSNGKKVQEWTWSVNNGFILMKNEFLDALNEFNPHAVVIQCCDSRTKKLFQYVESLVRQNNEKQFKKTTVAVIDDAVALEIAKEEYPESLSKYCLSLARLAQNSLMEHLRLGDKIMNIKFHSLQYLLPENKLKEALDRAFINVINELGVDINDTLHDEFNEPKQRALSYVCGFGPQKSTQFKRRIFGENYDPKYEPFINSRSILKDYLEPIVYHNCAGFLRICPNPKEQLDNSRLHPELYELAHKYPNASEEYFLMQLISRENADPFNDRRQDYKMLNIDEVFEMVTKETKDSLYPGLITPVVVNYIGTEVINVNLKKSGFKCNIDRNYIDNNIKEDDILDALVISINKEDITIKLSCIQMDLERGHYRSFYNKRFDEFIDKKAKQNYFPHPHFKRVSVQQAESELTTKSIGSYIIRPTTADPNKLSVTWKIYDNVYRHLHIIEIKDESELKVGHRLLVESEEEEYETLDELLATYIEKTNDFIDQLINHQKFRPTENLLNEFLEDYLQNNPYTAYGFYIDSLYPGSFVCGYKFRPGVQMLKMRGFIRPYGFRVENSRFYNIVEFINGIKRKIQEEYVEL